MAAYIKGAVVALIILVAVYLWYRANMPQLAVNRPPELYKLITQMEQEGVPDFTLERMDGTPFKLSEQKGKILVVNFWASWCNPCVEEFPSMIKLIDHYKEGMMVVAVATDDDKNDVRAFIKAFGLPKPGFEIVWDKNKSVMKAYGIEKVPESFLVGKDFKLIRKVLGIENWYNPGAIEYFKELIAGTEKGVNPHADQNASRIEAEARAASAAKGSNEEGAPKGGAVTVEKIPTH